MEKKKGLSIVGAVIILSISLIFAASILSNAITDVGYHMSSQLNSQHSNYNSNGNFELVVSEGWLYLYDTNTGQVWKKPDNPEGDWEIVKHYYE